VIEFLLYRVRFTNKTTTPSVLDECHVTKSTVSRLPIVHSSTTYAMLVFPEDL